MQHFTTLVEWIPRFSFSGKLEDLTQIGLYVIFFAIVSLFVLAYAVAKISVVSVYLMDHMLRFLWMAFKNFLPALVVVLTYHAIFHAKTRTPEEAATLAKGWLSMLWGDDS